MDATALLVMVIVISVPVFLIWHYTRAASILERWAAQNGYRIIEREIRPIRRGPYFFTTGRSQAVYRVTVEDREGGIRRGYVRCGGWFLGMFSDHADVRWDPEPPDRPGFPVVFPNERGEQDS